MSVKLIADSTDKLSELKRVSKEFESFVKSIEGVKNVTNTSADSPGEIIFTVDRERAASVGISPLQIYAEISAGSRGVKAGSITLDDEDIDIVVKTDTHYDELQIDKIQMMQISTPNGPVTLGSLLKYQIGNAIVDVRRVDGDLTISVEADARDGYVGGQLLEKLNAYAESYQFPKGVSYKK